MAISNKNTLHIPHYPMCQQEGVANRKHCTFLELSGARIRALDWIFSVLAAFQQENAQSAVLTENAMKPIVARPCSTYAATMYCQINGFNIGTGPTCGSKHAPS